jgi:hypothetical protein
MGRTVDLYPGEAKTDRHDAYVLAGTGWTRRKKVHWPTSPSPCTHPTSADEWAATFTRPPNSRVKEHGDTPSRGNQR